MKSKKILCLIATAIVVGALCIGCGTKNSSTEEAKDTTTEKSEENLDTATENSQDDTIEEKDVAEKSADIKEESLEIEVVNRYNNYYADDSNEQLAKISNETLVIYNEGYDKLKAAIKDFSQEMQDLSEHFADEVKETYETSGKDGMGIGKWFSEYTVHIRRADSKLLSFEGVSSTYTGGAHPYTFSTGWTYDSQTGILLGLDDVLVDKNAVKDIVIEKLENHEYNEDFFEEWKETANKYFDETDGSYIPIWFITSEGINFVFNPYEIAPYATGKIVVKLPFDEYKDILNSEYVDSKAQNVYAPDEDYGAYYKKFDIDLDSDGNDDMICVTGEDIYADEFNPETDYENADDFKIGMKVKVGLGKDYEEANNPKEELDAEISLESAFILENSDAKKYLYLQTIGYSDHRELYIFEIDGFDIKKLDYTGDAALHGFWPVDSSNFMMADKVDVMGTYFGYRRYHIGEDGLPVADEKLYKLYITDDMDRELVLKTDIKALEVVDIDSCELGGEINLKKGDKLIPAYSDDDTMMIFKLNDGKYAAVKYDGAADDYPKLISGTDEEEVFDNLIYAG